MLFSDLALILTIMINTLILHQSSEARMIADKGQPNSYPQEVLKRLNYLDVNEKTQRFPEGRGGRPNKTIRTRQRKWFLNPVMLKLAFVLDKYDGERDFIKTIYSGVIECGLSKCEKFQELIPENQLVRNVGCFKDNSPKVFKKKISKKLLTEFDRGLRIIEKSFQDLINFQKNPRFYNKNRRTLLHKLKVDIKMLKGEVEYVMTGETLNSSRHSETFTSFRIPQPDSETHLIINEWRIIQDSKQFLQDWQKNFEKMLKCWKKKRKLKKAKEKKMQNNPIKPQPPNHPSYSPRFQENKNLERFSTFPFRKNNF